MLMPMIPCLESLTCVLTLLANLEVVFFVTDSSPLSVPVVVPLKHIVPEHLRGLLPVYLCTALPLTKAQAKEVCASGWEVRSTARWSYLSLA